MDSSIFKGEGGVLDCIESLHTFFDGSTRGLCNGFKIIGFTVLGTSFVYMWANANRAKVAKPRGNPPQPTWT